MICRLGGGHAGAVHWQADRGFSASCAGYCVLTVRSWLNIADTYCGTGNKGYHADPEEPERQKRTEQTRVSGCKQDLIGIPWLFSLCLRADGWYLRATYLAEVVLHAGERERPPYRCYEHIFLLTKSKEVFLWRSRHELPLTTTAARVPHRRSAGQKYRTNARTENVQGFNWAREAAEATTTKPSCRPWEQAGRGLSIPFPKAGISPRSRQ